LQSCTESNLMLIIHMWIEITLNITCVSLIQWDVLGEMVIIQNGYFGADVKCHLYCMESCKRGTYRQVGKYPQKVTHPEILNSWILSRACLKCGYFKCAFPCFTQRTVSFSHTFYQIYSPLFLWPDFVPHGEHCLFDILGCSEMYTGSHVKFLVFFYSQWHLNSLTDFCKNRQYQISQKSHQWESCCSMQTDREKKPKSYFS